MDCHENPCGFSRNDELPYTVIANAVKQSIKTQMKYKTQNLNADSINLNDLIESAKIDLQV